MPSPTTDGVHAGLARTRFLGALLEASLQAGWCSAEAILGAFPPSTLIDLLGDHPEIRTKLLVEAAGIPERIASRRSAAAAREDLSLAFEERVATADHIVTLLGPRLIAELVAPELLWGLLTGGDWLGRYRQSAAATERASARLSAILRLALAEGLLERQALLASLSPVQLALRLEAGQLRKVFALAWRSAEQQLPVSFDELADAADLSEATTDLDPAMAWQRLVVPKLLPALSLGATTSPPVERPRQNPPATGNVPTPSEPSLAPPVKVSAEPAPAPPAPAPIPRAAAAGPPLVARRPVTAPRPLGPRSPAAAVAAPPHAREASREVEISEEDFELAEATSPGRRPRSLEPSAAEPAPPNDPAADAREREQERRALIVAELEKLNRIPRNFEYLGTAILRGIVRMYTDLPEQRGKAARAQCARAAFDNESHLRTAMLALLDLLEPELASASADAPVDELVEALLAAEKTLWQQAKHQRASLDDPGAQRRAVHVQAHVPPRRR